MYLLALLAGAIVIGLFVKHLGIAISLALVWGASWAVFYWRLHA